MAFKRKGKPIKVPLAAITILLGGGLAYAWYRSKQETSTGTATKQDLPKLDMRPTPEITSLAEEQMQIKRPDFTSNDYLVSSGDQMTEYDSEGNIVAFDPNRKVRYDSAGNVKNNSSRKVSIFSKASDVKQQYIKGLL